MVTFKKVKKLTKKAAGSLLYALLIGAMLISNLLGTVGTAFAQEEPNFFANVTGNGTVEITQGEDTEPMTVTDGEEKSMLIDAGKTITLNIVANDNETIEAIDINDESQEIEADTQQMSFDLVIPENIITSVSVKFTTNADADDEAVTPTDTNETETPVIEEPTNTETGTLQLLRLPSENIGKTLADVWFYVYADANDPDSIVAVLTTDETGYTNTVSLASGTYYYQQAMGGGWYSFDAKLHEVTVKKDENTIATVNVDPIAITDNGGISLFSIGAGQRVKGADEYDSGFSSTFRSDHPGWNKIGGRYVYCVQPHIIFADYNRTGDYYVSSKTRPGYISSTLATKLALAQYYATHSGYSTRKGMAIAQSMIWEFIMADSTAKAAIGAYGYGTSDGGDIKLDGTSIRGTAEYKAVKANVNSHTTKPSFNAKTYEVVVGQSYTFTDTNGVFSRYTPSSVSGVTITKSGNKITIKVTDASKVNSTVKIPYTFAANSSEGTTTWYYCDGAVGQYQPPVWQICMDGVVPSQSGYLNVKVVPSTGYLTLTKESANPTLTTGNSCYSLEGAVYTVYSDSACTTSVGKLTTKADGTANTLTLDAGTYYVKETTAPKGYAKDTTVHTVTVKSGETNTFKASDTPQSDPVSVLLKKVDADTGQSVPVTNGSLANAEFTFKFYAGEYGDNVNPATLGVSATRTWVMKTDQNGVSRLKDTYFISGDDFYLNALGVATLPIGTLTIQETKAPVGYHLNSTVYVRKITSNGNAESVNTYNYPTVKENAIRFTITKYEEGTTNAISGVKFTHTLPNGTTETLTTNAKGQISLTGLAVGKHKIVETDPTVNYVLNANAFEFEIAADGSVKATTTGLSNKGLAFNTDAVGNGSLTVYDAVNPFSLVLHKVNNESKVLADAQFTLYSDKNCMNAISAKATDASGNLTFTNLNYGQTYYFKETKAPSGYRLDETVHTIVVTSVSPAKNTFNFTVDGVGYTVNNTTGSIHLEANPGDYQIHATITNQIQVKLPETGSAMYIVIGIIAAVVVAGGAVYVIKSKKEDKN